MSICGASTSPQPSPARRGNDRHLIYIRKNIFYKSLKIIYSNKIKKGLKIAQNQLHEKPENIAVVGDQIFTDVIGGNLCKMYTILVDAIEEKDFWYTAWKRPIENKLKAKIKEQK